MSRRAGGASELGSSVGSFTYTVAEDQWSWSDELYEIHGYAPHAVPDTTETLLRHQHPDDAAQLRNVLEIAVRHGQPFSCYHRIVDAGRKVRSVVTVGRGVEDAAGNVVRLVGFVVDLTEVRRHEVQADVETALARIAEHRPAIEQAKGVLMLAIGCDVEEAFELLRETSSLANIKLHEVARRLVVAVGDPGDPLHPNRIGGEEVMAFLEQLSGERDHLRWSGAAV